MALETAGKYITQWQNMKLYKSLNQEVINESYTFSVQKIF